ncbi:hypothetical protein [Aliivibrio sifiae]|uniref:hypothetical protein n=1 Tax=Aliivibrio sifiae TaxID=566293 RepID=UPI003D10F8FC
MKTKIISLQFAYFLKDIVERPDLEFNCLNSEMLNIFDAMPQMIPVPRELPTDVPLMVLRSSNEQYTCNISRSRIDFIFNRLDDSKSNNEVLSDFNLKVKGLTQSILSKQEVNRFGLVARYFHQDNSAVHTLRNRFFSKIVDGAEELSLRFNKPSDSHGYRINDIVEINAAELIIDNKATKGILIQRDINNNIKPSSYIEKSVLSEISTKYAVRVSESAIEGLIK